MAETIEPELYKKVNTLISERPGLHLSKIAEKTEKSAVYPV
jgi:hypothetical protein